VHVLDSLDFYGDTIEQHLFFHAFGMVLLLLPSS
jgi:hypothetical protein